MRWRTRRGLVPGVYPMSVSRIEAYRSCPQLYHRRYIDHLDEPDSAAATFGRQFHAYAAARLTAIRDRVDLPPRPPAPSVEDIYQWDQMCAALEAQAWEPSTIYSIEEPMEYRWTEGAMTVAFEGIMDLVTIDAAGTTATISDTKTGWAIESGDALFTQLQSQAYVLLLFRRVPTLRRVRFQQIQFRYGGRAVAARHPGDGRDYYLADDAGRIQAALQYEVGQILRDQDWLPSPGCVRCPVGTHALRGLDFYKPITVNVQNGYLEIPALTPPTNEDEATRLALTAHVSRRIEAAAREALKGWCADNGPLHVSPDEALGHWERSSSNCIDIPAALEIVAKNGLDLGRYLRLNMSEIKALIDPQSPRYLPALAGLIEAKTATTFGFHKVAAHRIHDPKPSHQRVVQFPGRPSLAVILGGLADNDDE